MSTYTGVQMRQCDKYRAAGSIISSSTLIFESALINQRECFAGMVQGSSADGSCPLHRMMCPEPMRVVTQHSVSVKGQVSHATLVF